MIDYHNFNTIFAQLFYTFVVNDFCLHYKMYIKPLFLKIYNHIGACFYHILSKFAKVIKFQKIL